MNLRCQWSLWAALCLAPMGGVMAQDKVPAGHFAVVNGEALPNALMDQAIVSNGMQPQALSPDARRMLKTELAARAANTPVWWQMPWA